MQQANSMHHTWTFAHFEFFLDFVNFPTVQTHVGFHYPPWLGTPARRARKPKSVCIIDSACDHQHEKNFGALNVDLGLVASLPIVSD